jgi:hypothetical protein
MSERAARPTERPELTLDAPQRREVRIIPGRPRRKRNEQTGEMEDVQENGQVVLGPEQAEIAGVNLGRFVREADTTARNMEALYGDAAKDTATMTRAMSDDAHEWLLLARENGANVADPRERRAPKADNSRRLNLVKNTK